MAGQPCAVHPKVTTFVRCGRCDRPICTDCMVDTPTGKKCRECARSRTHLTESNARQVSTTFVVALAVALPMGWLMHAIPLLILGPVLFGYVVGEAALRAGQRRRSAAMQVATGGAALVGGLAGTALTVGPALSSGAPWLSLVGWPLAMTLLGVVVAVSRVRFF